MRQYDRFLGNPNPNGASSTVYVYRTGLAPAPASVDTAAGDGSQGWRTPLLVALALAGAAAGLVVWARS